MSQSRSSSNVVSRKAICASGSLGDIYSVYSDTLVGKCNLTTEAKIEKMDTTQCEIIESKTNKSLDILRQILDDDQLIRSLRLNLAPRVGIGAFFNHPQEINTSTRILHYVHQGFSKELPKEAGGHVKSDSLRKFGNDSTHVITGIDFGIEALIILQIPYEEYMAEVDRELKSLCQYLSTGNSNVAQMWLKDKVLHRQYKVIEATIYSNMPALTNVNKLWNIAPQLTQLKKQSSAYRPIQYYLRPIEWIYPKYLSEKITFQSVSSNLISTLENSIFSLRTSLVTLERFFKSSNLALSKQDLKEEISTLHQQRLKLRKEYDKGVIGLSDLICDFRRGQNNIEKIEEAANKLHKELENNLRRLVQEAADWEEKGELLNELRRDRFKYCNAAKHGVIKKDNKQDLERKLIQNHQNMRILCSHDQLNRDKHQQFTEQHSAVMEQRRKKANLQLIYADFTYSDCKPQEVMILSSTDTETPKHESKKSRTPNSHTSPKSSVAPKPSSSTAKTTPKVSIKPSSSASVEDTINILLVGESGVGKSTFINALVNYLAFDSFEEVRSKSPTVLISISFLITTGDHFEEHIVKLVDFDHSNNEDFDHPGQSVTQQCRSYVFPFRHSKDKKIRIIDTPGFGDTRGLAQDDLNIEHILRYIHQLSHLNAICFLLKPNCSQLNMFFRSCLMQLFSLLGPNAQQNIIFCFTSARSTFYTPGDTALPLRNMLRSLPMRDIQFKKDNTFCFDDASFRHLVALQNGIIFTDVDRQEYEKSWTYAVNESHRLLEYISMKLPVYHMQNADQSIKAAQLQIDLLISPILETMRNLLRNLILATNDKTKNQSIIMSSKSLDYTAGRCLSCPLVDPVKIDPFFIRHHLPHRFANGCQNCSCDSVQHSPMYHTLEYQMDIDESNRMDSSEIVEMLDELRDAGVEFAYFLVHVAHSTEDDPIFVGLTQMIMEENQLNPRLSKEIRKFHNEHEDLMRKRQSNRNQTDPSIIYDIISNIEECPPIHEQMTAIKQTRAILMDKHQHEVY